MLAELSRKREAQKLKQLQTIHDVLSSLFYPHLPQMRLVFEKIMAYVLLTHSQKRILVYLSFVSSDRHGYFKNPVSKAEVPDYFEVIKKPMSWSTIEAKLDANEYWNIKDFQVCNSS